ncbi:hypothetical protein NSA56_01665 [Oceanobacillus caeni]|uniref:hypothetical protein n=1 Tax=Oceanobacillus caeni TaxID=405946 RepID=UPI00214A7AED|nr:hypothetical protein [Oceanobacillus caeni]MCR1833103.1 hypothetical protein [Oceanobacillus caeni]
MNNYIKEYKRLRHQGYSELEAFGTVSGAIAMSGSLNDLRELYLHYVRDLSNETHKLFVEMEELNNERIVKAV